MKLTAKLKQSARVSKIPTIQPEDRRIAKKEHATSPPPVQACVTKKESLAQNPFTRAISKQLFLSNPQQQPVWIALAFSGGVDSVLLAECFYRLQIPFTALHFNHSWRGRQSKLDAQWVQTWCHQREIPCYIGTASIPGRSSENQARIERFNFLQKMAKDLKIKEIWMAHHADDLVETFLMQLMRGAGPDGLASLRERHIFEKLTIIRPWLHLFKEELIAQANAWRLEWREDKTNQDFAYLRNRVRLQLLPFLSQIAQRDIRRQLLRTALLIADENAYWSEKLPSFWPLQVSILELKKTPIAFQRRWLKGWLQSQKVSDLSFEDIEAIRDLLLYEKPAKVNLSKGRFCQRKNKFLQIV